MNYARQQNRRFRIIAAFAAATVVLTLAVAAIPAQAQTPTVIYSFPGGSEPANP
jgi:spermidine/putrescine-binding protein